MNFRDELSSFAHTSFHSLPPQQQLLLHRHSPTCTAEKHHWRSAIGFNQLNLFRKINKLQKFMVDTCDSNQLKLNPCPSASMVREISGETFFICTHVVWPSHASTPASVAKALPDLHSRKASLTKRTFCSRHHWFARRKTPLHSLEQPVSIN